MTIFLSCFFIYAFLGWCAEVIYAALKEGRFVNRGVLHGALCPIYGFGVAGVVYLLEPVRDNLLLLFLGAILLTSLIELVTGFLLEKIFHQRWWDYTGIPFNIGGYICPLFSVLWGIACVVVVDRIHPLVLRLIEGMPRTLSTILLSVAVFLLLVDTIATAQTLFRLKIKFERTQELAERIKKTSDELGGKLAATTIEAMNRKEDMEERLGIGRQKRMDWREKATERRDETQEELRKAYQELKERKILGEKRLLQAFPNLDREKKRTDKTKDKVS